MEPPISAPNCPRLFGTFRDPNDCRVFYNCRNGLANRFECAPGLAFDTKTNVCVWADQVKSCRAMSRSGHDSADVFQCPNNVPLGIFSKHAHPEDCRLYFVCISGVAREYGCPHGTVFSLGSDEFTGKCSDPRAVPECSQYYGDQVFDEEEMAKSGLDTGKPSSDSGSGSFKIEPRSSNYIRNPRHNSPGLTIKELAELNVEINRDFSVPHVKRESPKFTAINKFHYPKPQKPSKYSPRKSQRTPTTPKQNTLAPVKQKAPATITVEEYFPKKPTPAVIVPPPTDPTTVGPPVHYSLRTGDPNGILEIVLPAPVNKKYGLKSQVFEPHTPKPLIHKTTPQTPRTSPHTPRTSPHTPKTSSNPSETSPHTPRTPSPPQKKPVLFQHSPQPKQSFPIPPIPTSRPSKHQQVVPVTIPHHDGTVDKAEEPVEVVKVKGPGDEYYYYYYYDDDEEDATEEDGGNAREVSEVPNKN